MADSKKKALIQAAAEMIRKAGAANVGADTELAHITPAEKAKLKADGGSGKTDPTTGLPHFDAGGKRGDSHAGNASGGYGGSDRDGSDDKEKKGKKSVSGFGESEQEQVQRDVAESVKALTGDGVQDSDNRGGKEQLPALPSIPNVAPETPLDPNTLQPYQEITKRTPNMKNAKTGAGIGTSLLGPGVGTAIGAGLGSLFGMEETKHLVPYKADAPRTATESNGGSGDKAIKAPVADESTDTTKLKETVAAPTFDDFVAGARKKKGYMSTILGGGVPAGTPQGKRLLGS